MTLRHFVSEAFITLTLLVVCLRVLSAAAAGPQQLLLSAADKNRIWTAAEILPKQPRIPSVSPGGPAGQPRQQRISVTGFRR